MPNVAVKVASETMFVSREFIAESPTLLGSIPERGNAEKTNVIRLKIHDTPNKAVNLGGGYTFVTGNETKTVSIGFPDEQSLVSERQQVKKVIRMPAENMADITGGLEFSTVGDAFQLAVIEPENNVFSRHIIQFDEASVIDQYFTWLMIITLLMMGAGLFYALWLAGRISQPLESLSRGFRASEQGE